MIKCLKIAYSDISIKTKVNNRNIYDKNDKENKLALNEVK